MKSQKENVYLTGITKKPKHELIQVNSYNEKRTSFSHNFSNYEKELKESFLDFLIQDKTNLAQFNKIENYYRDLFEKNLKKYNDNKNIIKKKKELLEELSYKLNEIILNSISFEKEKNKLTQILILELKEKIKIKEIELEWYKHLHSRTYKTNFLISKRIQEEIKFESVSSEQYEKYKLLKNNVLTSLNRQMNLLNNMNHLNEIKKSNNQKLINQKVNLFNKLEFEVLLIKNDTIEIEKKIFKSINEKEQLNNKIKETKIIQKKIFDDYLYNFNHFHSLKIKLIEIFKILKLKNLDKIIIKYNKVKQKYNELSKRYSNLNKEIATLNVEFTNYSQKLNNIKTRINNKIKGSNLSSLNNLEIKKKFEQLKIQYKILEKSFEEKISNLSYILTFILNSIQKIILSLKNPSIPHYYSFKKKYINKYKQFLNNEKKYSLNLNFQKLNFDENFIKFITSLFLDFCYYLFTLQSCANDFVYLSLNKDFNCLYLNYEFSSLYENTDSKNNISQSDDNISSKIQNFIVYSIKSNTIKNLFDEQIKLSSKRLINKEHLYNKNKDSFDKKDSVNDQTNIKKNHLETITRFELLNNYLEYFQNQNKSSQNLNFFNLLKIQPYHNMSIIEKYTNEFVDDNILKEIKENKRYKSIEEKSKFIKYEYEKKEMENFIKKKKIKNNILKQIENESSSDDEEKENKNYKKMRKLSSEIKRLKNNRNYSMCFQRREMNDMFNRANDLRKLELYYNKENNKNLRNQKKMFDMSITVKKELNLSRSFRGSLIKRAKTNQKSNNLFPYIMKKENSNNINNYNNIQKKLINKKVRNVLINSNPNSIFTTKTQERSISPLLNSNSKNKIYS